MQIWYIISADTCVYNRQNKSEPIDLRDYEFRMTKEFQKAPSYQANKDSEFFDAQSDTRACCP